MKELSFGILRGGRVVWRTFYYSYHGYRNNTRCRGMRAKRADVLRLCKRVYAREWVSGRIASEWASE